ncbi:Hpt domain-containing protein [Arcicella rigui]|uniref:Hpt domain-containing protein n=1 Tax=Arcicella rigui TaxID=797020 RepID=A0ABU5QEC6_9BACT|nr:Hpt domain-containing protein [Arcicella rigui]MEA5141209.1 Hpt domain-containing protein [Arcicella rigui]
MFETFLESNLPYWDEVQTKLKAQKYDEIAKPIHTLKPSFSMIGFPEVTEQVREYEAFVKTKPSIPDLLKGAAALDVEVNRVKNILIEEISKMEAEGY